ncbi:MAG: hypothetical protein RLZZ344_681 [Pseudomonadota bacterium]|jgi:competence protein ComEA
MQSLDHSVSHRFVRTLRQSVFAGLLVFACALTLSAMAAVNPNQATPAELETIRGIGPSMAARIIAERQKNGPYKSPQDFARRVSGVGPKRLKAFQDAGLAIPVAKLPEPSRPQ